MYVQLRTKLLAPLQNGKPLSKKIPKCFLTDQEIFKIAFVTIRVFLEKNHSGGHKTIELSGRVFWLLTGLL